MGAPSSAAVDVRDMLCAQALAVVAQALEQCRPGTILSVAYNAEDVKRDLLVWARDRGYAVRDVRPDVLQIGPKP